MIASPLMPTTACGLLFAASGILFLVAAAMRRKLGPTQGGLAVPERCWTYDQRSMVDFVAVMLKRRVPAAEPHDPADESSTPALIYYAETILPLDIKFAVLFALFIVSADVALATWFAEWPWVVRACMISACLGGVYGFADVGEDVKLRSIFCHAARAEHMQRKQNLPDSRRDEELADASEVDAANALTRVKMATVAASLVGYAAFRIFQGLDALIAGSTGGRTPDAAAVPHQPVEPSPSAATEA